MSAFKCPLSPSFPPIHLIIIVLSSSVHKKIRAVAGENPLDYSVWKSNSSFNSVPNPSYILSGYFIISIVIKWAKQRWGKVSGRRRLHRKIALLNLRLAIMHSAYSDNENKRPFPHTLTRKKVAIAINLIFNILLNGMWKLNVAGMMQAGKVFALYSE